MAGRVQICEAPTNRLAKITTVLIVPLWTVIFFVPCVSVPKNGFFCFIHACFVPHTFVLFNFLSQTCSFVPFVFFEEKST